MMVAIVLDDYICQLTPQQKRETVSISDKVCGRLVPQPCELSLES